MLRATVPELLRVNLASTVLMLKDMGIENVLEFDFIEAPAKEQLVDAVKQLYFLRALDKDGKLTDLGVEMNKFPLEPSFSKTLLAAHFYHCWDDACTMVALLSSEKIWTAVSREDEERSKRM